DLSLKQYETAKLRGDAPPALPGFNIERSGESPGMLRRRLSQLSEEEIVAIARMLANNDGECASERGVGGDAPLTSGSASAQMLFKNVSGVADEIHSGMYAQDVVDALRSLFSLYSKASDSTPTAD